MYRCILLASKYNAIALGKMSQVQHHHNFDKNGYNVRHARPARSSKKKTKIPYYYSIIQNKDKNVTKRKYIHTKKQRSDILIIEYKFI